MDVREYEEMLDDAETQLTRLKHLYDQWFQGLERLEPTVARKKFDRTIVLLRKSMPRKTAYRFRFQQLIQRYTMVQSYWRRTARQIEEGTYRRDLMKARKMREGRRADYSARTSLAATKNKSKESKPTRSVPPPIVTKPTGPGDVRIRQIYDAYVDAKKANSEPTERVSYEKIAKSIKQMVPELERKHKGRKVDFEVIVKDGRVGLKPVLKK